MAGGRVAGRPLAGGSGIEGSPGRTGAGEGVSRRLSASWIADRAASVGSFIFLGLFAMSVSRPLRTLHEDRPPTVHRCGGRGRVRHSRRQPGVTGAARLHDRRLDILSAWGPERNRNSNLFLIIVNGGKGGLGGAKRPMGTAPWRCCGARPGGVAKRDDRSFPDTALKGP